MTSYSDCVPETCEHATTCVHESQGPDCSDTMNTEQCVEGTLDCGQGTCTCNNGICGAVI